MRLLTAIIVIVLLLGVGLAGYAARYKLTTPEQRLSPDEEVVAQNLMIPWEIVFLPEGGYVVTERPGRLVHITADRRVIPIAGVEHVGEGGLLGMTLHPQFSQNRWLYLYLTTQAGEGLINRIERYVFKDSQLTERTVILNDIPGAAYHDGGRLAFGPDGLLYITTGDATQEALAQDTSSLAGKILRIHDDGRIPEDNPFGNAVYSYGHRNSQGITWDKQGRLWATEHGRSGIRSGLDELNLIAKGKNYGWPVIEGDETRPGMEKPVLHSGATDTWAPGGAIYINGSIFFGGLRGETLYEAKLIGNTAELTSHFIGQFGRIRTVAKGPDGLLYLLTSNTDGRGQPRAGDDKLIRLQVPGK